VRRDYETLDAVVTCASLVMVAEVIAGLIFIDIPQNSLPVLSSLATGVLGLPLSYGAFRWGNNVGAKQAAEAAAETSKTATGALAQIAGAGSPPPPTASSAEDAIQEPKP